jgi:hypothetical protein
MEQTGYIGIGSYTIYEVNTNAGMHDKATGRLVNIGGGAENIAFFDNVAKNYDINDSTNGCFQGRYVLIGGGTEHQRNMYFGGNQTIDLGVDPDSTHYNSGEVFMNEGHRPVYDGYASAVTSNTVEFSDLATNGSWSVMVATAGDDDPYQARVYTQTQTVNSVSGKKAYVSSWSPTPDATDSFTLMPFCVRQTPGANDVDATSVEYSINVIQDWVGRTIAVHSGKGFGQYRVIESFDMANGVFTLNEPWAVTPDTNSLMTITYAMSRTAFYGNNVQGRDSNITINTAACGVSLYGSSFDVDVVGNTFSTLDEGVNVWSLTGPYSVNEIDNICRHNMFVMVTDNTITNLRSVALRSKVYNSDKYPTVSKVDGFGTMFRDNYIEDAIWAFTIENSDFPNTSLEMIVFEGNTVSTTNLWEEQDGINTFTNNNTVGE